MNPSSLIALSSSSSSSSSKRKRNPNSYDDDAVEPICKRPKNDVFLNFSEDIGKSFVSHLLGALRRHSFTTVDHTRLPTGQDECSELLKAIEESEIYVLVFTINYAFSERCLDELVQIMDGFRKFARRKVLPVFFNVEPSHVRNQQGSFEEAFEAYETSLDPERVQKWKQTLKDACQLSGHHLQNGDEEMFVRQIVEELEKMQNPQQLHVTYHHPVGIGSRVRELISNLKLDSEDVSIVAVLGTSGIGKTIIAKATYNSIARRFDVCCFLADIHHHCGSPDWRVCLQMKLISCLVQNNMLPIIPSHNDGVTTIRKLISRRKVLLVLDDVSNFEQLKALGIHPAYFYDGSRVIVTTRDKQSLGDLPYASYNVGLLNASESFKLFSRLTFAKEDPINKTFVKEIVDHAAGLPLVLEVWSRHFKHHEREQWGSVLETLKRIPHGDVQKQLRMSYDALTNRAKKLFLDIACFFHGKEKDLAVKVLEDKDLGFFPDIEIGYLVDKCLLKNEFGGAQLMMHHAIREMGEEIVRQENEDEPGERSRLWDDRDVLRVLRECSGTNKVESIFLNGGIAVVLTHHVQVEALRKMSNLRLIRLKNSGLRWTCSNDDDHMPNSLSFKKLKYLEWMCFPFKRIDIIDMCNVVVVKLPGSRLEILWEGMKSLKKLRILDVCNSPSLTKTGNFYGLENLEQLNFVCCENLEELHSSVGCLDKLAILNLSHCTRLKRFPWEMIGKLQSLQQLSLDYCPNIGLELGYEDPDSLMKFTGLRNLRYLSMQYCNMSQVPREFGNLVSLQFLELSGNTFSSLPDSFSNLSQLDHLIIKDCYRLRLLPLLPPKLKRIEAAGCWSLDVTAFVSMQTTCISVSEVYKMFLSNCGFRIHLSGDEVPMWCNYRYTGHNLSFAAPMMHLDKKICGMIFCATSPMIYTIKILNKTKETSYNLDNVNAYVMHGKMSLVFFPLDDTTLVVEAGDIVVLQFIGNDDVTRCGLRLIYEGDGEDSSLVIPNDTQPTLEVMSPGDSEEYDDDGDGDEVWDW